MLQTAIVYHHSATCRYGLWVFDHSSGYFPRGGTGGCSGASTTSVFSNFFAWNVDKGAEIVLGGHVRFQDFLIADARSEGIAIFETYGAWGDAGPGIYIVISTLHLV